MTSAPSVATAARDRCREWRLPSTARSVSVLRRGLNAFLQETSLSDDQLYDLLPAACGAAGNAIEHAQDPSEPFVDVVAGVHAESAGIVVRDFGEWRASWPVRTGDAGSR